MDLVYLAYCWGLTARRVLRHTTGSISVNGVELQLNSWLAFHPLSFMFE